MFFDRSDPAADNDGFKGGTLPERTLSDGCHTVGDGRGIDVSAGKSAGADGRDAAGERHGYDLFAVVEYIGPDGCYPAFYDNILHLAPAAVFFPCGAGGCVVVHVPRT